MKFPTTILLKFNHQQRTQPQTYWVVRCLLQQKITPSLAAKFRWFNDDFISKKQFQKPYKFTLTYSEALYLKPISKEYKQFILKTQKPNPKPFTDEEWNKILKGKPRNLKLKENLLNSNHIEKQIYDYLTQPKAKFNHRKLRTILSNFRTRLSFNSHINNKLIHKFNLIFFRKEKIYTKLKYSRVPQYDAVSGGAAALLAGFLGYLITEKFGLELSDSGDFWFVFLYLSFFSFFCHPMLKMIIDDTEDLSVFSYLWGWSFYSSIFTCFITFVVVKLNKIKQRLNIK